MSVTFQSLQNAYDSFSAGRISEGATHFQQACQNSRDVENGVYGKMWELKQRPTGNNEFGRYAFHGIGGLTSTALEKAMAIQMYMSSRGIAMQQQPPSEDSFEARCTAATITLGVLAIPLAIVISAVTLSGPFSEEEAAANRKAIDDLIMNGH